MWVKLKQMDKWKIWIIACVVCSLILGIGLTVTWVCQVATANEYTMQRRLDFVWVIPFGFIFGFFLPFIVYPLARCGFGRL